MSPRTLTISRLAASADVHVETVRYYQRRGLLHVPERPARGVRCYGAGDVSRLRFIRRAQAIGFSLDEIAGLLNLGGERSGEQMQRLVERKLAGVRLRFGELRQLECALVKWRVQCSQLSDGELMSPPAWL